LKLRLPVFGLEYLVAGLTFCLLPWMPDCLLP
jgi:hypothetical protein